MPNKKRSAGKASRNKKTRPSNGASSKDVESASNLMFEDPFEDEFVEEEVVGEQGDGMEEDGMDEDGAQQATKVGHLFTARTLRAHAAT